MSNSVIISVSKIGESECSGHLKSCVNAENKNHKLQSAVNHAVATESQRSASFAEQSSLESRPQISKHVAVHVRLHLEAGTLEILNPKRSLSSASLAVKKSSFRQHTDTVNTARQLALMLRELEKKSQIGKVELLQKIHSSTCLQNGNPHVCEYGSEIKDAAKNAGNIINTQIEHSMFTTSEALQNSQSSDQRLQILCCYVLNAIGSFIPEEIQIESSYEINLEIVQGYLPQVPGYSDSAAYKALGNSMAVNVMQLLGERIKMVNDVKHLAQNAAID